MPTDVFRVADSELLERCWAVTASDPGIAARKIARQLEKRYDEAFGPLEIRWTQFTLLVTVALLGEAQVRRVAEVRQLDPSTMTRNLAVLERRGMVRVHPGEDRRSRMVSLTDEGEERLRTALAVWEGLIAGLRTELGDHAIRSLLDLAAGSP